MWQTASVDFSNTHNLVLAVLLIRIAPPRRNLKMGPYHLCLIYCTQHSTSTYCWSKNNTFHTCVIEMCKCWLLYTFFFSFPFQCWHSPHVSHMLSLRFVAIKTWMLSCYLMKYPHSDLRRHKQKPSCFFPISFMVPFLVQFCLNSKPQTLCVWT